MKPTGESSFETSIESVLLGYGYCNFDGQCSGHARASQVTSEVVSP